MPLAIPDPAREELRARLRQAVPVRIQALLADHPAAELAALLPGMAHRAGAMLGHTGDALLVRATTGAGLPRTPHTSDELVTGIAALVIMSGRGGIIVLGDYYAPVPIQEDAAGAFPPSDTEEIHDAPWARHHAGD